MLYVHRKEVQLPHGNSTPVCFIDAVSSARGALLSCRLLNPNLSGQRDVARQSLAARARDLMRVQFIVVHTLNQRCQESRPSSAMSYTHHELLTYNYLMETGIISAAGFGILEGSSKGALDCPRFWIYWCG